MRDETTEAGSDVTTTLLRGFTAMVNLHFLQENDEWIRILAVPLAEIQRLCLRPLRWLRFVAFAILGAKGNLYDTPGPGTIVNYDIVVLNDDANYYFFPDGPYSLIDHEALNDRLSESSVSTPSRSYFRASVAQRDGNRCVISSIPPMICDAAHIIPHAKGNAYIHYVITQRRSLYNWDPPNDIDIDMTENGMFLKKDIHALFGFGMCGFLKTPNFALRPDDIPRVIPGDPALPRVTLQHIKLAEGIKPSHAIPQDDVLADWFGQENAPPSLILDYMYGVAVMEWWRTPEGLNLLNSRHNDFAHLPPMQRSDPNENDDDDGDDGPHVDDSNDPDYVDEHKRPARRKGRCGTRHHSKDSGLCQAIDLVMELSLRVRGHPPGTTVAGILQKQQEEAEMRSHQIAREKVEGWLERGPAD